MHYKGKSEGGVYPIYPHKASKLLLSPKLCNSTFTTTPSWLLWYNRLRHPNHQVFSLLFPNKTLSFNKCMNLVNTCTHCLHGKMHKLPFPDSKFVAHSPFELVHTNCGVLHFKILLMVTSIMCYLLIVLPVLLGYI